MKELLSGFKKGYALDAKLFLRFLIETKRSDAYEIEDVTSGDLQNVTTDDINAFTQYLRFSNLRGGGISNNSIVRRLNGLESFFNYCIRKGIINDNPVKNADRPERTIKENPVITATEIEKLFMAIQNDHDKDIHYKKEKLRDTALIRLLVYTDCTIDDTINLTVNDVYSAPPGKLAVPGSQDSAPRYFQLDETTWNSLIQYLRTGRDLFEPNEESKDALFLSRVHQRLSKRTTEHIFKKYSDIAFEKNKQVTLTDLKRSVKLISDGPCITEKDIENLFTTVHEDSAFAGRTLLVHRKEKLRDEALLRLLIYTDCSINDIPRLTTQGFYKSPAGSILLQIPEGRTWKTVPIDETTDITLKKYVYIGRDHFKPDEDSKENLFLSRKHTGLSKREISYIVNKYLTLTFGKKKRVTLHDLRRTVRTKAEGT